MRISSFVLMITLLMLSAWVAANGAAISAIRTAPESRASYLAHATIWNDPGDLSPAQILAGPPGIFPKTIAEASQGIDCTFAQPGKELGGNSAKFLCATGEGQPLRLKYWDQERNRQPRSLCHSGGDAVDVDSWVRCAARAAG